MLKQLIVENYKSIRQATIDLEGINVFVGANGSGKSNLLSLFELMSSSVGGWSACSIRD